MIPINNSDTAWLIVSDYNQENNLSYEDLREDILNPEVEQWSIYYYYEICGTINVGGHRNNSCYVGNDVENPYAPMEELYMGGDVGGLDCGENVGGNHHYD